MWRKRAKRMGTMNTTDHIEKAVALLDFATSELKRAGDTEVARMANFHRFLAADNLAIAQTEIALAQAIAVERLAATMERMADVYDCSRPF